MRTAKPIFYGLLIILRCFFQRDVDGLFAAVAFNRQGRRVADFMLGDFGAHVVDAVDFGAVDFEDDIALLQACFVSWAACNDLEDIDF